MIMDTMEKGVKHKRGEKKWDKGVKKPKFESEKEDLYKAPTNEELNSLKETEELFHSSLFRLQIEELLNEVKVNKTKVSIATDYVQSLTSFLTSLKEETFSDVNELFLSENSEVKFPLCQTHAVFEDSFKFVFRKPKDVRVSGGFSLGIAMKPNVMVDLVVEMPSELFHNSDCRNHGYHHKRAFYLTCLAKQLKKNEELCNSLRYTYFQGDFLKPVLLLKPKEKLLKRFTFVIIPIPPRKLFKLFRLSPSKSNIKSSWFFQKKKFVDAVDLPTPKYNTSILIDLTLEQNCEFAKSVIGDSDNIRDGIILIKVWLHQRQLDQGLGSFSPFIVTMYIVYLLETKKLNLLMSSYQIARNFWLNLKLTDWSLKGITLAKVSESGKQPPALPEFHNTFEVVFVDTSGYVNLCANMSGVTFHRVRNEAELAIDCLDNGDMNSSFDCLFMTHLPFLRKFDHLVYIAGVKSLKKAVQKCDLKLLLVDNCGNYAAVVMSKVIDILKSGLSKRIKFLDVQLKPTPTWSIDEEPLKVSDVAFVSFGLLLDPILCMSILDKGPPADSGEAVAFKEFWGEKSELRRFHDSTICEAVVWPGDKISERRMVCEQITRYVLESHVGIDGKSIRYIGGGMDALLCVKFPSSHEYMGAYGTGEEQTVNVLTAYDSLVKQLRNLDALPLKFSSIQGTSAVFRYTEVFPQLPIKPTSSGRRRGASMLLMKKDETPLVIKPQIVILKLEASSKWPHDLEAIRHLKTAFYIELSKTLRRKFRLLAAAFVEHVDVLKDGYVFRLVIASKQELVAHKVVRNEMGIFTSHDTKESIELEIMSELIPKVTSSLHGLQMQHGSFCSTCRLAKRWVASQLLGDHMPDITIDLIVAQLFLMPFPFTTPSCPQVGFFRFLQLIVNHDWKNVPFIVNLNEELKKEEITEIHNLFVQKRSSFPSIFIATPYNKFSSYFTKEKPTLQILHRLILLATETTKTLEYQLSSSSIRFNPKIAFRPPLEPYDVIIHFHENVISTSFMGVDGKIDGKVLGFGKNEDGIFTAIPPVDYNPAICYLKELRHAYGHLALFFYDEFGGTCMGVLFKPDVFKRQQFKINDINGMMVSLTTPGKKEVLKVVPNVKFILEDFRIIGRGLVRHVEAKEDRWDFN